MRPLTHTVLHAAARRRARQWQNPLTHTDLV